MQCPNCAKTVPARAAFCPRCGSPLVPGEPVPAQRVVPAGDVHEELIGPGPRFRFVMFPPSRMFVIPIIIILLMLGFGCCVIPIRL